MIYEYVTSVMKYDKTGKGWGRGDAVYACDIRRGNCTDFHSLFIAPARARGIPARFIIGFPLGTTRREDFRVVIVGQNFIQAEYGSRWTLRRHGRIHRGTIIIFGHLDADRVAFTMGRDLALKPPQRGALLNYLIYPYAELDGAPIAQDNQEQLRVSRRIAGQISLPADHRGITLIIEIAREFAPGQSVTAHSPVILSCRWAWRAAVRQGSVPSESLLCQPSLRGRMLGCRYAQFSRA